MALNNDKSRDNTRYDVVVIGGGPAGLSASSWCAELGLRTLMLEKESSFGGQLHWIHNPITNYLGMIAANGEELLAAFERSVSTSNFERITGKDVVSIDQASMSLRTDDGETLSASVIILATGVRRRTLGIPGETEFVGRGVLRSGSGERKSVAGKIVVVVGGGDAAAENALILAEYATRVYLVHRRAELSARPEFLEKVERESKIVFLSETVVESVNGGDHVESITVRNANGSKTIEAEHFIVRAGVAPNSELLAGIADLDERGYVKVDIQCRTTAKNIYAIGDVTNSKAPTIAAAAGMGSTAAKSAFSLLNTSK